MFDDHNPMARFPRNTKAGITVCFNQHDEDEPFETTVYFKKSGKSVDELPKDNAITLTASGKLRLNIGKNGFVEIFAENAEILKDADDVSLQEETNA